MTIKRTGKCKVCKSPTVEIKIFAEVVNMFEPETPKGTITRDLGNEIREWRKKPMYCDYNKKRTK